MAQQPAVVIIARHGARLDAADQTWHLSTPTPYDPPLTYGGWNQCRSLGMRIATLLHAREHNGPNAKDAADGVAARDFADADAAARRRDSESGAGQRRRRRRKHKVVIHTSPFLRCLQTSVAIAAGMGQYGPAIEVGAGGAGGSRPSSSGSSGSGGGGVKRTTSSSRPGSSPRVRAADGAASPLLSPVAGSKHDLAHSIARKALGEQRHHRKARLRVEAFLGEWLNPQYYDGIMPPPPSAMMVATAKAELMQNDEVEVFVPTTLNRPSGGSLWGGAHGSQSNEMEHVTTSREPSPQRSHKRDRANSQSSGSGSGRRSPYRTSTTLQPLTSIVPKQDISVYHPPTPHYAISPADVIPRGYVAHAKNACTSVDYQWDSSRPPLNWGSGGEYGEEWSEMHRRFRRGLNSLIEWYSRHEADDRSEDALGLDQASPHAEDEEEDLVIILVTHGAGCNALIGALTGQPVLLDVGMASLTMAVRREDAPPVVTYASSAAPSADTSRQGSPALPEERARRGILDLGLSSIYEMKLISSTDHVRPGGRTGRPSMTGIKPDPADIRDPTAKIRQRYNSLSNSSSVSDPGTSTAHPSPPPRSSTSAALGSIRRPSVANIAAPPSPVPVPLPRRFTAAAAAVAAPRSETASSYGDAISRYSTSPTSPGLWTPPAGRLFVIEAEDKERKPEYEDKNALHREGQARRDTGQQHSHDQARAGTGTGTGTGTGDNMTVDFSTSPASSRPATSAGAGATSPPPATADSDTLPRIPSAPANGDNHSPPKPELATQPSTPLHDSPPAQTGKGGLWGNPRPGPFGDTKAPRLKTKVVPKRRWTGSQG